MDCNHCQGHFCVSCSKLEKHKCPGLKAKIEKDRELLSKRIAFEKDPKCLKI